jgi:hypothetical protein
MKIKISSSQRPIIAIASTAALFVLTQTLVMPALAKPSQSFQQFVQPLIWGEKKFKENETPRFNLSANAVSILSSLSWMAGAISSLIVALFLSNIKE